MLPELTLPASLAGLLVVLRPVLHRAVVRARSAGWWRGCAGRCTAGRYAACCWVPGWGATWPHDRAHRFFARARWDIDEGGIAVAQLVMMLLVPPWVPRSRSRSMTACSAGPAARCYGAFWQHDGSAPTRDKMSFGNCFVTIGIVVSLPFCTRPVCLPVLARLNLPCLRRLCRQASQAPRQAGQQAHRPRHASWSPGWPAGVPRPPVPRRRRRRSTTATRSSRTCLATVTWTCRLIRSAVLYDLAPPKVPGKPGRGPCSKAPGSAPAT